MHKKYADEGFAAISVALDDPADKETREKLLRFLQKQAATFPNFILDEPPELWQEKLKLPGPPGIFVFDRQGRIAERYPKPDVGEVQYDVIEKRVQELLQEK